MRSVWIGEALDPWRWENICTLLAPKLKPMKQSIALVFFGASLTASMAQSPENLDLIYTTDSSFIFASQILLDWDGAMAFAESLGGHLATFHDVNENNAVQAELSSFNTLNDGFSIRCLKDTEG